jgi:dUTP pyrophosphatase
MYVYDVMTPSNELDSTVISKDEAIDRAHEIHGVVYERWGALVQFTLGPGAKMPEYAHKDDSGADLFASEEVTIHRGEICMVDTGLKIELSDGCEAQIRSKSGLAAKHGVYVLNSPGTVDCGYRGPVKVILHNVGKADYAIHPGDKIAQIIIAPYIQGTFREVSELSETARGEGGFGSTGRQ